MSSQYIVFYFTVFYMRAKIPAPLQFFSYNSLKYAEGNGDIPKVKKNI